MSKKVSTLFLCIILLLLATSGMAARPDSQNLLEKTFSHDNSYCTHFGKRIEFEVRSLEKYTLPDDSEYGEHVFAKIGPKHYLMPVNQDNLGSYKLFKGHSDHCTKSLALPLNDQVMAIFFLKDNRPMVDTLSILYVDFKSMNAKFRDTEFTTSTGLVSEGKLSFPHSPHKAALRMGKTQIKNKVYIYQEKELITWYKYDGKTFESDTKKTYDAFDLKHLFGTQEQYLISMKNISSYFIAVNHQTRDRCIALPILDSSKPEDFVWKCEN